MKRAVDLLATCPGSPSASFLARHNLACLLRNELDFDAALREWDAVLREPLPPNDAPARYARTTSEVEFADLLGRIAAPRGDSDLLRKAVSILDAAIARERVPELPGTRAQVHRALVDRIFAVIALTAWERQGAELDGVREKLASKTLVSTLAWVGSDAWDRPDAAIEEYVRLADEWGVDEISHHAGRLKAMFGAQNALATAKASILPWTSVAEKRGEKEDDSDQFHAAVADEMHVQTLARLARFYRYGQPFVLLLRSFGEIAVAHAPGAPVPMVSTTYPTPSIGHELDGAVAAWLEPIAPVVSVTQQAAWSSMRPTAFSRV